MVLFGLWHKATLLFLVWGCYHGVLLVAHRQLEALQRKYDWTPPQVPWNLASWITTMALVNLGWIFFRSSSPQQARQMLAAVFSPGAYGQRFLSGSLYLLVLAVAAGYGVVLLIVDRLNKLVPAEVETGALAADSDGNIAAFIARYRWFWLAPLYALALLFLLIVTLSHGTSTAQLMYGN